MRNRLPLFILKMVLLPGSEVVLRVFEPRYKNLLQDCLKRKMPFGVVYCKDPKREQETMAQVGCLANILDHTPYEDGTFLVRVEGGERFRVEHMQTAKRGYFDCDMQPLEEDIDMALDDEIFDSIYQLLEIYLDLLAEIDPEMVDELPDDMSGLDLTYAVLDYMALSDDARQKALEIRSLKSRCEYCLSLLRKEIERLRFLLSDMDDEVAGQMN